MSKTHVSQSTIEHCYIDFQLLDDNSVATKQHETRWFHFRAVADSPNEEHVFRYTTRLSSKLLPNERVVPQQSNTSHVAMWQQLVDKLQHDGWQLHGATTGNWWEQQFQRDTYQSKGRRWPWIVLATIILLATSVVLYTNIPRLLYLRPITPLAEMGLVNSAETPQLSGKILLLNADTNRVDPLHAQLPDSIAAKRRSAAKSAVWIDCVLTETATTKITSNCVLIPVDIAAGIQHEAVKIPDSKTRQLIGRTLEGDASSSKVVTLYEYRDEAAILAYINSLVVDGS